MIVLKGLPMQEEEAAAATTTTTRHRNTIVVVPNRTDRLFWMAIVANGVSYRQTDGSVEPNHDKIGSLNRISKSGWVDRQVDTFSNDVKPRKRLHHTNKQPRTRNQHGTKREASVCVCVRARRQRQ